MTLMQLHSVQGWLTINMLLKVEQYGAPAMTLEQQLLTTLQEVVRTGPRRASLAAATVTYGTIGYNLHNDAVGRAFVDYGHRHLLNTH